MYRRTSDRANLYERQKSFIPQINYWWLLAISLLLRWVPFISFSATTQIDLKRFCLTLSYATLLFALTNNLHIKGVWILLFGTVINYIAIVVNGGFMPVSPNARYLAGKTLQIISPDTITLTGSGGIVLPVDKTVIWCFTDIIPISFFHTVFSIGDIIIAAGILVTLIHLILLGARDNPKTIYIDKATN